MRTEAPGCHMFGDYPANWKHVAGEFTTLRYQLTSASAGGIMKDSDFAVRTSEYCLALVYLSSL